MTERTLMNISAYLPYTSRLKWKGTHFCSSENEKPVRRLSQLDRRQLWARTGAAGASAVHAVSVFAHLGRRDLRKITSDWFICFNLPIVDWAGPTKSEKSLLGINSYFHSAEALNITNLRTGLNLLLIKCSPSQQVSWGSFCQAWVSTLHCFVC